MLPNDIIALLSADTTLTGLLGTGNIYPTETTYLGDCVLYDWYVTGSDGTVVTSRLELTAIAGTLSTSLAIERRIDKLLITPDDRPLMDGVTKVIRNGGGSIRDAARKKYHRYLYFDISSKGE